MKTTSRLLPILILLLNACAAQNDTNPSPTPEYTATSFASSTPEPTQTPAYTPTSINRTDRNSMNACTRIVDTGMSQAGTFQVVFAQDQNRPASAAYSEFGINDDAQHTGLALWTEDTRQTIPYPLPEDTLGPKISPDHRWILFRRDVAEAHSEFWVIGTDGRNETKLGTIILNDTVRERFPPFSLFALEYGWLPNTNKFYYLVDTYDEFGDWLPERFFIVDADSGLGTQLTLPPGIKFFRFAPDGDQVLFATENELYLFNTRDGQLQFTFPISINNPKYSPDGTYIIDFNPQGILRINARDGNLLTIPLKYTIMLCCPGGDGPMLRPLPHFEWVEDTAFVMSSLISDQQFVIRPFEENPAGWMFTTWIVDIVTGTTTPGATFNGDPDSVVFSPDGTRLAFSNLELSGQTRQATELHLADVNTGEVFETITLKDGSLPEFITWSPDSKHYLYLHDTGSETAGEIQIQELFLGEIGADPVHLSNLEGRVPKVHWLDAERFSLQMGICLITGYETINLISPGPPVQIVSITP